MLAAKIVSTHSQLSFINAQFSSFLNQNSPGHLVSAIDDF